MLFSNAKYLNTDLNIINQKFLLWLILDGKDLSECYESGYWLAIRLEC